jgi:2-dehydropantoate 2-reductase
MTEHRIAVVGTGASGASIAADLTRAGCDVSLIDQWPAHVEAMRKNGLRIEMPEESQTTPVKAFHLCEVAELRDPFDIVLIAVKAYDTRWTCELIAPLTAPKGLVVGVQNGMTMDDIAAIVGPERTLGCVPEIAANMFEPGVVNRQSPPSGTWFALGAYDERTQGREAEAAEVLGHAGTVEISDDIRSAKWMKLIVNAAECLPSAILDMPLRQAVETPGIRDVMMAAGIEATHTALALGHKLVPILGQTRIEDNDPDRYASSLLDTVLTGWALPNLRVAHLQDWMKGRRAEVAEINGIVTAAQETLGGTAPVNAALVDISLRIERGELEPGPANADMLRALI